MNEQQQKFEAHVRSECDSAEYANSILEKNQGGFYHVTRIQGAWEGWQAAIAAQAPRQALSDAEIKAVVTAAVKAGTLSWIGYEKDEHDKYTIPMLSGIHYQLSRAIEAASGPNAALVEALTQMVSWFGRYPEFVPVPEATDHIKASIKTARAALAAVREGP